MCLSAKTETTGAVVEKVKISANPDSCIIIFSSDLNKKNEYTHFVFLPTNKKVISV